MSEFSIECKCGNTVVFEALGMDRKLISGHCGKNSCPSILKSYVFVCYILKQYYIVKALSKEDARATIAKRISNHNHPWELLDINDFSFPKSYELVDAITKRYHDDQLLDGAPDPKLKNRKKDQNV